MSYSATIAYLPVRSSLVNLPASVSSILFNANIPAQNVVLELKFTKKGIRVKEEHVFVGWTGMTSSKDINGGDKLEIDPTFASNLGLEQKQKVTIIIHANPPQAHTIHLDPLTSSDWEIVETHAEFLESWMINQVRAVSKSHTITVYPSGTSVASLAVVKIEPEPSGVFGFAQLSPDSEIVIAPKVAKKVVKGKSGSVNGSSGGGSGKKSVVVPSTLLRGISLPHLSYQELDDRSKDYVMEVYVDPDLVLYPLRGGEYVNVSVVIPNSIGTGGVGGSGGGTTGTTGATGTTGTAGGTSGGTIASTNGTTTIPSSSVPSPSPNGNDSDSNELSSASSVVAKIIHYRNGLDGHVALSYALSVALGISNSVGNIIKLEIPNRQGKVPSKLSIHPISTTSTPSSLKLRSQNTSNDKKLSLIKEYLLDNGIFSKSGNPITNLLQLPPIDNILPLGCVIEFEGDSHWFLTKSSKLPNLILDNEIVRGESTIPPKLELLLNPSPSTRPIVGIDQFLLDVNEAVRSGNKGTLIYGTRVAGKTSVLKQLESSLNQDIVHTIWFPCGIHAEKQIQTLKETLRKLFLEAAWYSPSVIIFDDLDKLIPAELEHSDSTKTRQLAEVFKQLVESITSVRNVSIIASSVTKESLHSSLITNHIFEEILHLKSPDKYVRETILNEAITSLGLTKEPSFDILEVAGNTEGYQPGDLWTLVERANHETLFENIQNENDEEINDNTINQSHFDLAMKDFIPSSLRGVKLQKSTVSWSQIGGLKDTKNVILETLEWPTRYAPIFANCPLRLRSGLLLYGYPGCGKTLLASAVAAQCGLNFISIKGPEILNKYIGASEQSVRDLFDRAQAAKPCILFFDEFDSIAPKRGHDSTGVTDRVVNQMLTQMDGAEGLDGVYVLAATSRPDLIDSALLRPGRLDKSLICDLPSLEDRLDILHAVQGDMKLSDSISLLSIAEQTDGFSGADLQALLYNAYMEAIHDVVDIDLDTEEDTNNTTNIEFFQIDPKSTTSTPTTNRNAIAERTQLSKKIEVIMGGSTTSTTNNTTSSTSSTSTTSTTDVIILPRHISKSLSETKPSISLKERNKLAAIYHQFVDGRSGEMPTGNPPTDIGGRATLM